MYPRFRKASLPMPDVHRRSMGGSLHSAQITVRLCSGLDPMTVCRRCQKEPVKRDSRGVLQDADRQSRAVKSGRQ